MGRLGFIVVLSAAATWSGWLGIEAFRGEAGYRKTVTRVTPSRGVQPTVVEPAGDSSREPIEGRPAAADDDGGGEEGPTQDDEVSAYRDAYARVDALDRFEEIFGDVPTRPLGLGRARFREWLQAHPGVDVGFLFEAVEVARQRLSVLNRRFPAGIERAAFHALGYRSGSDLEVIVGRAGLGGVPSTEATVNGLRRLKGEALGEEALTTIAGLLERRAEHLVRFRSRALAGILRSARREFDQGRVEREVAAICHDETGRLCVIYTGDEPALDAVLQTMDSAALALRDRLREILIR